MRREIYLAIALIGTVFTILYAATSGNEQMAVTSVLITLHVIAYLYLWDEWRYYRSHNAILASFQFIAIPIVLLVVGNIMAPLGFRQGLLSFSLSTFGGIFATSSLASFILLVPIVSILRLTARYYDDRYSGFVIRNKRYGSLKFPLLIHIISVVLVILSSNLADRYDVFGFAYIVASIFQWLQKLIYPTISDRIADARYRRDMEQRERRGYMSSILSNTPSRSRRGGTSGSSSNGNNPRVTSSNASTTTSPRSNRRRSISTTPSSGYREIPTRSRNAREIPANSRNSRTARRQPTNSVAEVDHGMEVNQTTKTKKVKSSKLKEFLPSGHFDASDLKCIVCYDAFSVNSTQNIVICPECKFPGHESEFMAWLNTSPRCPRCNKEINNRGKLRSKTVSESQYAKFIQKI